MSRTVDGNDDRSPGLLSRGLGWWQISGGAVGLIAALVLTIEKMAKLADPGYIPSCSLNPVVSCGSIMDSPQAELFGFPNPLLGLMAFPVVIVAGVLTAAGVPLPVWFRRGLLFGLSLGVVFIHWLIWASLYRIGALCPYCMVVWAVTIPLWWYTLLAEFDLPRLRRFHSLVLAGWVVVIASLIFLRFDDYWLTLF